jgi:hypothetical protein
VALDFLQQRFDISLEALVERILEDIQKDLLQLEWD